MPSAPLLLVCVILCSFLMLMHIWARKRKKSIHNNPKITEVPKLNEDMVNAGDKTQDSGKSPDSSVLLNVAQMIEISKPIEDLLSDSSTFVDFWGFPTDYVSVKRLWEAHAYLRYNPKTGESYISAEEGSWQEGWWFIGTSNGCGDLLIVDSSKPPEYPVY